MSTSPSPSTRAFDDLAAELGSVTHASVVEREYDLGALTTYRVGGRARLFVRVETSEDLAAVVSITSQHAIPVVTIGRGSNMLIADHGFDGLAMQLGEAFADIEVRGETQARVG